MRRRKIKGALERFYSYEDYALPTGEALAPALAAFLGDGWLGLEIGAGRGDFLVGMATQRPEGQFIGIEMKEELQMRAAHKLSDAGLSNVRLLLADVQTVFDHLPKRAFDAIYLNFSDPWPKDRHAKRRLTHPRFLEAYKGLLKPGGRLVVKTDNPHLYQFSLDSLEACGYVMIEAVADLAALADPLNVPTEYEAKFVAQGIKIHRIVATLP